jgi:hypothetical protein
MTVDPSDPVRRQAPDLDPGLAPDPDPEHQVDEDPPEGAGPTEADSDD